LLAFSAICALIQIYADRALSTIFKTTDHGVPHVVGFIGGLGSPQTEASRNTLVKSLRRWKSLAAAAGVDTLIANHQGQDEAVENLEFLKIRRVMIRTRLSLATTRTFATWTRKWNARLQLWLVPGKRYNNASEQEREGI